MLPSTPLYLPFTFLPNVFSNPCSFGKPNILFTFIASVGCVVVSDNDLFLVAVGSPFKVPTGTVFPSESTCILVARLLDSAAKSRRFSAVYGYVSGFIPVGDLYLLTSTLLSEISFAGITISSLVRSPLVFIFIARPSFVKNCLVGIIFPSELTCTPKSLNVSNVICS